MHIVEFNIYVDYRPLPPREFQQLSSELYRTAIGLAATVPRATELDFTLEDGSIFQRILLIGSIFASSLDVTARYHDLRESVIDLVHDGRHFADVATDKFLHVTGPARIIYKRTSSVDVERLHRIVARCDEASHGVSHQRMREIQESVVYDLAELARANPNDPEVQKIIDSLPHRAIPGLPRTPKEAIARDKGPPKHESKAPDRPTKTPPRPHPRHSFNECHTIRIK